ncbi:MAG: hypothetical protein ACRCZF_03070, partial [Gemmataceae bacterium]
APAFGSVANYLFVMLAATAYILHHRFQVPTIQLFQAMLAPALPAIPLGLLAFVLPDLLPVIDWPVHRITKFGIIGLILAATILVNVLVQSAFLPAVDRHELLTRLRIRRRTLTPTPAASAERPTTTIHFLTGEFPPEPGGVSDYTAQLAEGLAATGHTVHVWTRGQTGTVEHAPGVLVHRVAGRFGLRGLWRLNQQLRAMPAPRIWDVQFVPQMYGFRGMNLLVPLWLLGRRLRGDRIQILYHEVSLEFRGGIKIAIMALVQRFMILLLTTATRHAAVTTPEWGQRLQGQSPWRLNIRWRPVPATLPGPGELDPEAVQALRRQWSPDGPLVGHFGTYGHSTRAPLDELLPELLRRTPSLKLLLLGRGAGAFAAEWETRQPEFLGRLIALENRPAPEIAMGLAACDLAVQIYLDGASTRRTTLMAALKLGLPVVSNFGKATDDELAAALAPLAPGLDMVAVAETVTELLADAPARAARGQRGAELYAGRFALPHSIAAVQEFALPGGPPC